ncbi:MAG: methionine synthase [Chitinivibrionales bacterium]|nr:methionine synthase [Chitinivibrionales bacterium]MBD3395342.1 methionine synthase [Chitinivibrionales bacterium]
MRVSYQQLLSDRLPVIFDGAMGTELQRRDSDITPDDRCGAAGCNEILNITRPDIIRSIHCEYLRAGAHVIETNTFGANRFKLREFGLQDRAAEINRAGVQAAREAVEECRERDIALVCGCLGPTGILPSSSDTTLAAAGFDELAAAFEDQASALLEGGVDLLLLETMQDLLEIRAALAGIRSLFDKKNKCVPLQVQVTLDRTGRTLLGGDIMAFLGAAGNLSPAVLGLNCGTGPDEMVPHARALVDASPVPVSMIPNAGMPENVDGTPVYRMEPGPFAGRLADAVLEAGVSVVGGCCGTGCRHIEMLSGLLKGKKAAARSVPGRTLFLSTGLGGVDLEQAARPVIIGERLNAQGSRKTKELVLAGNYDELYQLALEQQDKHATLLDLCMAINERDDEPETMTALVRFLRDRVAAPFCIDSTDPVVFAEALKQMPGAGLVNSINLEKGGEKARKILATARSFGCPVIALPIDDAGMAKTVGRKLELAGRIHELACEEFGLPAHFVYFDPLVYTLATGDIEAADAAKDSLDALREVKRRYPGMRTVMGVSNVSFGLGPKARRFLNNMMLHHASRAGLDAAIFNPLHLDNVDEYDADIRKLCDDLLLNRRANALERLVDHFEEMKSAVSGPVREPAAGHSPEERLKQKLFLRDRRDLVPLLDELLHAHPASEILNTLLLPAMAEIGERMARGEMILPFVLQAAEIMKESVTYLEPHFGKDDAAAKGKIILATVYGDVHDIGKNLVGSILKNQGFEVIDLGKQVPLADIVAAVRRENPDAVGLSALLVTTSREMAAAVKEFDRLGYTVPLLIGGAAVNRQFAERISAVGEYEMKEEVSADRYAGGVYYAKDAFEAMRILETFKPGKDRAPVQDAPKGPAKAPAADAPMSKPPPVEHGQLVTPMFFGTGDMLTWDAGALLDGIDRTRLYKGYWRTGRMSGEEFERNALTEFDPAFDTLKREILDKELIDARGYYGFWPVYVKGETVYLLHPSDHATEVAAFTFPRMRRRQGRSIADWVRPEGDILALQVVTIGPRLAERSRAYFEKEDKYTFGFFLNGIGNFLTEEIADKVTTEVRRAMYVVENRRGTRYGFGYPGLPGLEKQRDLLELLCAEDRLGITLTPGCQMVPEHSTVTVFVHHPESGYL